jgi:perosamine synthetase
MDDAVAREASDLLAMFKSGTSLDEMASRSIAVSESGLHGWVPAHFLGETQPTGDNLALKLLNKGLGVAACASFTLSPEGAVLSIEDFSGQAAQVEQLEGATHELGRFLSLVLGVDSIDVEWSSSSGVPQGQRQILDSNDQAPADRILTAGPMVGPREIDYVLDAARSGWNLSHSNYLDRFEADFARFVGSDFALATSSCTGALHLALLAVGVGVGHEVIVPETTWVATASAVRYTGATPVFADVDPRSWTLDPDSVRSCISDRTRAVVPVHLYGYPADMAALMSMAEEHGLSVIEDAAPAIGATVLGKPVGSFGDFGAFSFQGAKMLVTGEGGMLVTSNQRLRDRAWKLQDHGRKPGTFWIDELGYKYKMSNLTAALGLAQLESVNLQIARKRQINSWYREFLAETPGVSFQEELPDTRSICWMTSITIDPMVASREVIVSALRERGIDSRPVFPAISQYPFWADSHQSPGVVAARIGQNSINLPSGVKLTRPSVDRVASVIREAIAHV